MQQFQEGQIADGPNGPLVYRGGRWFPLAQPATTSTAPEVVLPAPPPPPPAPPSRTAPGAVTEGLQPGMMWVDPNNPAAGQVPIPTAESGPPRPEFTATQQKEALDAYERALKLDEQLADLKYLYDQGPGTTSGIYGLGDFVPTDINKRFNTAGTSLRATLRDVMSFTGVEMNRPEEVEANVGPYIPKAGDRDSEILDKFARIERERDSALRRAYNVLGGIPDGRGRIVPLPDGVPLTVEAVRQAASVTDDDQLISAFDVLRTTGGAGPQTEAAPTGDVGGGGTTTDPYPDRMIAAHDDMVRRLVSQGNGRLDPQAYAEQRETLFREFGYAPGDRQSNEEWATGVNQYLDAGGRTIPSGIMPAERLMSATETMRNNLVNNPIGGALVGASNAAALGGIEAFTPEQMMALRDAQGVPVLAGEIAGGIGATMGIGGAARLAAGRVAPQLLQGGARGQFARNVATDAAYGAGYGGISQGDPLTGAAFGTGGSVAGQGVARGLGAAVGGAQRTAAAQALRDRGVPISVGRQLGMGRAEDLAMSIPIVGDMVRGRQMDSFAGFNRAAFEEAGRPVGFNPVGTGQQGLAELRDAIGNAYDDAVEGQVFPIDDAFNQQIDAAFAAAGNLPDDLAARATQALQNRVEPLRDGRTVFRLQEPSTLATPLNPTPAQMQQFARVEDVPLSQVRSDQSRMSWAANARGQFNQPLVDGFGQYPLALRMNNGEFLIRDGNHRTVRAFNAGRETEPMYVVNASDIDPQNAGPRPSAERMSIDDLAAELGPIDFAAAAAPMSRTFTGREAITGQQYQQARRGLKGYRAEATKPGFEKDYRNVMTQGIDALDSLVTRQAGPEVVQNLGRADQAYRASKTLENAMNKAAGGSQTGEIFTFTPNQLQRAGLETQRRYPGARPFADLADAGQQVLPSTVPNSGTADRAMAAGALAALGLGGAGVGEYAATDQAGATATLGTLGAAAALLGTRRGQQVLEQVLMTRPQVAQQIGSGFRRRAGLFGSTGNILAQQGY